jgi:hypothetical protein
LQRFAIATHERLVTLRRLDLIHNDVFQRSFRRLKLQAELLLQSLSQRRRNIGRSLYGLALGIRQGES